MMFFKKLFVKKKIESQIPEQDPTKPVLEIDQSGGLSLRVESSSGGAPIEAARKSYDISLVKKQSTQVKNKDGFLAAVILVKDFISSNEIDLKDFISLLKKVIPYMKKESSIDDADIICYMEEQIKRFAEKDDLDYQADIADLYSRIDNAMAIDYLESKLGDSSTDTHKTLDHYDSFVKLSDCYLADKKGDRAFKTLQRARNLVTNFDNKFDFIQKHKVLAEKSAVICFYGQKKPKYADYLYYEIVSFVLDIANDLCSFPHLTGFFYRKNISHIEDWKFSNEENFNKALEGLNIHSHKQELMKDIYAFSFNDLPLKMGIPSEYLKEDLLEPLANLIDDYDTNYPEWEKIRMFKDEFTKRHFDISLPLLFAGQVIKMYVNKSGDKHEI